MYHFAACAQIGNILHILSYGFWNSDLENEFQFLMRWWGLELKSLQWTFKNFIPKPCLKIIMANIDNDNNSLKTKNQKEKLLDLLLLILKNYFALWMLKARHYLNSLKRLILTLSNIKELELHFRRKKKHLNVNRISCLNLNVFRKKYSNLITINHVSKHKKCFNENKWEAVIKVTLGRRYSYYT